MPIGTSLGVTLPTDGASEDVWGGELNTALTAIVDAVETPVPSSGININANLEWNGYEVSEMGAVRFENKSSAFSGASNTYKLYSRDGELYWNDGSGNEVKLTASGSLNSASLGGINGDYGGADPADVSYTAATSIYRFTQDPGVNGKIDCGDILLRETVASANAVTIKSPTSLASSYSFTLPTAVPGSTSVVMMSSAGALSTTLTPSVTSITATSGTITTLGSTTATVTTMAGAVAFSGTPVFSGYYKHGEVRRLVAPSSGHSSSATFSIITSPRHVYWEASGASQSVTFDLPVMDGERIKAIHCIGYAGSAASWTFRVHSYAPATATGAQLGSTQTSGTSAAVETMSITGLTTAVAAGTQYTAFWSSGASGHRVYAVEVVVDRA